MTRIDAYLHFNGNCREAMTFYKDCLGGELSMQTVGESPVAEQVPAAMHQQILHSRLVKDGLVLLASDMMEAGERVQGNTVSLCIDCSSEQEIKTFFANLSAGAKVGHPLKEEFWGATFGELTDRFGINWLLNFDKNQNA